MTATLKHNAPAHPSHRIHNMRCSACQCWANSADGVAECPDAPKLTRGRVHLPMGRELTRAGLVLGEAVPLEIHATTPRGRETVALYWLARTPLGWSLTREGAADQQTQYVLAPDCGTCDCQNEQRHPGRAVGCKHRRAVANVLAACGIEAAF